ncbi:glycosyl transferase [Ktedonosporobacter rubrisoli]|uniref:Glycosyl transferase n=1 Tax=Ktedonosporobacter rubrisoli TaxID=2509675 RepID=A0A4P6JZV8_KTERU|nr:macrolide family glycosyltransferase [Ktedonosporobacter rubrisoli]QBD81377.1 glycosyl transferase [Ktedonosporobacter rubrisoli]
MGKTDIANRLNTMARLATEGIHEIPPLIEQMLADKIACVLYDRSFIPGVFASKVLHLPAIQLNPSFAMNEQSFRMMASRATEDSRPSPQLWAALDEDLGRECEAYNLPRLSFRELMASQANLHIVFVPRAFQPASETFDEHYVFIGPSLPALRKDSAELPAQWRKPGPLLYISLGTAFNDWSDFYRMCFEAFAQSEWQVVLSFGRRIDPADLPEPPANFLLAPHVPQLEVLAQADLFISHGGMNSTMESLWFGVPLVVVPQMVEQEMNARRVQELGLGLMLEKETLTPEKLQAAVAQMAKDTSFPARVQEMQQAMRQAGGAQRAAEEIMHYVKKA